MGERIQLIFLGKRGVRSGWKMLISIILFLFLAIVLLLGIVPFFGGQVFNNIEWDSTHALIIHLILLCAALLSSFIMTRFFDGRPFASLGYSFDRGWIREVLLGVIAGFTIIGLIFAIGAVSSIYRVSLQALGPAALTASFFKYAALIFIFAAFEEVLFRGYLLQTFIEGAGRIISVSVLSMIFGLIHYLNPNGSLLGVINTGLAGILLSVAYVKTRSLWLPSFIHFSWNFSLGYIFGFPVSGIRLKETPMMIELSGTAFLSGGEFGPEASIFTTIVLLGAIMFFMALKALKPSDAMSKRWDDYRKVVQNDIR